MHYSVFRIGLWALISTICFSEEAPQVLDCEVTPAAVIEGGDAGLVVIGNKWVVEGTSSPEILPSGDAGVPGTVVAVSIAGPEQEVHCEEIAHGERLQVVAAAQGSDHAILMLLRTLGRPFTLFANGPLDYSESDFAVASVDIAQRHVNWVTPIEGGDLRLESMCYGTNGVVLVGRRYEVKLGARSTVPVALSIDDSGQSVETLTPPKLNAEALYDSVTMHDQEILVSGLVRSGKMSLPFVARYAQKVQDPEVVVCHGVDVDEITGMSASDHGVLVYGHTANREQFSAGLNLTIEDTGITDRFGVVIRVLPDRFDTESAIVLGGGFLDTVAAASERDGSVEILMLTYRSSASEWELSGRSRLTPSLYRLRVRDGGLIESRRLWASQANLDRSGYPMFVRGSSSVLGIGSLDPSELEWRLLVSKEFRSR